MRAITFLLGLSLLGCTPMATEKPFSRLEIARAFKQRDDAIMVIIQKLEEMNKPAVVPVTKAEKK